MALPTNYKDQVLDSSMSGLRQFAMIKNSNGTYSFRDVSTYTQTGSTLAADDVNAINTEINLIENDYSKLDSPTFSGVPKAPTANIGTSSTQIATTAFVSAAIAKAVAGITQFNLSIVSELPETGVKGTIYLMPATLTETQNIYKEYIWMPDTSTYEEIGTTAIDLSNYATLDGIEALTNKTYNGYALGDACTKGVDNSVISGSSNLVTSGAVSEAVSAAAITKTECEAIATKAESYAHGGTSSRTGEDSDNSQYYSTLSMNYMENAQIAANKAEAYSSVVAPEFKLDDDMTLYLKISTEANVDFILDDNAVLLWKLTKA